MPDGMPRATSPKLLIAEFGFVLRLRGLTICEYVANRDTVAGTVYYVMLVVFAAMPLLVR